MGNHRRSLCARGQDEFTGGRTIASVSLRIVRCIRVDVARVETADRDDDGIIYRDRVARDDFCAGASERHVRDKIHLTITSGRVKLEQGVSG